MDRLFNLKGKVALVTGGGAGMGKFMAEGLAEAGANVVVCSRKGDVCQATAKELESYGVAALGLRCDLTKQDQVEQTVAQTLEKFGQIDVLVNNSGTTWGAAPEKLALDKWQKVFKVNVDGTFLFSQMVGREMIKQGQGKIINVSSYAGLKGTDPEHLNGIAYNSSKAAVLNFTRDLATKWASYNINVNCLAPGWFPSKMTNWMIENKGELLLSRIPLKRFGQADDIKGAVVYLASKASDYVTGQVLPVDGGLSAWI